MTTNGVPGEATIRRRIHNGRSIMIAAGDFSALGDAWSRHAALWDSEPDGLSSIMMRQALAAASLHLANRPRNETVAWTVSIQKPPANLFVTGSSVDATITGRVMVDGVRPHESNRLFVQTSKGQGEPHTSALDVQGWDLLSIFEQFYLRSEQNPARFFPVDDNITVMVLGMPGVERNWLVRLEPAELDPLIDEALPLDERIFRFECGCTLQKVLVAVRSIYRERPEELFRGEPGVEAFCPRCGRRWWIEQSLFAEAP